jgi:hypothetical protein
VDFTKYCESDKMENEVTDKPLRSERKILPGKFLARYYMGNLGNRTLVLKSVLKE